MKTCMLLRQLAQSILDYFSSVVIIELVFNQKKSFVMNSISWETLSSLTTTLKKLQNGSTVDTILINLSFFGIELPLNINIPYYKIKVIHTVINRPLSQKLKKTYSFRFVSLNNEQRTLSET